VDSDWLSMFLSVISWKKNALKRMFQKFQMKPRYQGETVYVSGAACRDS